jgi:putative ABC transport system permease protein
MRQLLRDLRFSLRTLRRTPGFTLVSVLTLALGIGATTAIFSVADGVLARPLPYADQDRLMVLMERWTAQRRDIETSYPDFRDWRDQNHVFAELSALTANTYGLSMTGLRQPVHVEAAAVSSRFFATLGVAPLLGRGFLSEEDRPGARHVMILGHPLWQQLFGGDPAVIGRQLRLDGDSYTVVGVMPASFQYPRDAAVWIPLVPFLGPGQAEVRYIRMLKAIGRLAPGVGLEQARAEMAAIAGRLDRQYNQSNAGFTCVVHPLTEEVFGKIRPVLLILLSGVLVLLLIAVANVANLLLARNLERRQEIGLRAALGASRRRLVQQLVTEASVLTLLGGATGWMAAAGGIRLLIALAPDDLPRLAEARLDQTALLFTAAVLVAAATVFGLVPAVRRDRDGLYEPLKQGARRSSGSTGSARLRGFLVRSEVALAMLLLLGAGLLIQSVVRLARTDPGFDKRNVLTARIRLAEKSYPTERQRQAFFDRLRERAGALPGVTSTATVLARPLDLSLTWEIALWKEGQSMDEALRNPLLNCEAVSPGYFRTLKIRLLRGRPFDAHDDERAPLVVILSQRAAAQLWPGQNPLGKRIRHVLENYQTPWRTVVGVAGDVHYRGWDETIGDFYVPWKQNPYPDNINYQDLVLRTTGSPLGLAEPLRQTVLSIDPNLPIASIVTLDQLVDRSQAAARFSVSLMGLFGALALCLAAVGIYGVLSYSVEQRRQEIGIRMALGAREREVVRMVLTQGLKLTAGGLAAGLAAGLLLTRFMASLLYGVSIFDPLTFLAVPLLLAGIGLLATWLPAVRAAAADPIKALRYG